MIVLPNPRWCALTGFASEELISFHVSLVHGPLSCRDTLRALSLSMAGNDTNTAREPPASRIFPSPSLSQTRSPNAHLPRLVFAAGQSLSVVLASYTKAKEPFLCSITSTPLLDADGLPSFNLWTITQHLDPATTLAALSPPQPSVTGAHPSTALASLGTPIRPPGALASVLANPALLTNPLLPASRGLGHGLGFGAAGLAPGLAGMGGAMGGAMGGGLGANLLGGLLGGGVAGGLLPPGLPPNGYAGGLMAALPMPAWAGGGGGLPAAPPPPVPRPPSSSSTPSSSTHLPSRHAAVNANVLRHTQAPPASALVSTTAPSSVASSGSAPPRPRPPSLPPSVRPMAASPSGASTLPPGVQHLSACHTNLLTRHKGSVGGSDSSEAPSSGEKRAMLAGPHGAPRARPLSSLASGARIAPPPITTAPSAAPSATAVPVGAARPVGAAVPAMATPSAVTEQATADREVACAMDINCEELAAIRSLAGVKRAGACSDEAFGGASSPSLRAGSVADSDSAHARKRAKAAVGGGSEGGGNAESRVAPFVHKLKAMLDAGERAIYWDASGTSFWIADPIAVETTILPQYFKHNRMAFFVKQLRAYGFKQRLGQSCLDSAKEWFHEHAHFHAEAHAQLHLIQRASSAQRAMELRHASHARSASSSVASSSAAASSAAAVASTHPTHLGTAKAASANLPAGGGASAVAVKTSSEGSDSAEPPGALIAGERRRHEGDRRPGSHGQASGGSGSSEARSGSEEGRDHAASSAASGSAAGRSSKTARTNSASGSDGSSDGGESGEQADGSSSDGARSSGTSNTTALAQAAQLSSSPRDTSHDGSESPSDRSSEVSYSEVHADLEQINQSIETHRTNMREQRNKMMQQIEGIMAHLRSKEHPIHAAGHSAAQRVTA